MTLIVRITKKSGEIEYSSFFFASFSFLDCIRHLEYGVYFYYITIARMLISQGHVLLKQCQYKKTSQIKRNLPYHYLRVDSLVKKSADRVAVWKMF